MKIGMYSTSGDIAVVLPADEFCNVTGITRDLLGKMLNKESRMPEGYILTKLPDSIPNRTLNLKIQKQIQKTLKGDLR